MVDIIQCVQMSYPITSFFLYPVVCSHYFQSSCSTVLYCPLPSLLLKHCAAARLRGLCLLGMPSAGQRKSKSQRRRVTFNLHLVGIWLSRYYDVCVYISLRCSSNLFNSVIYTRLCILGHAGWIIKSLGSVVVVFIQSLTQCTVPCSLACFYFFLFVCFNHTDTMPPTC